MNRCTHCGGGCFPNGDGDLTCLNCARPQVRIEPLPRTGQLRRWYPQACARCGVAFIPTNGTQRYCTRECARTGERERRRAQLGGAA